MSFAFRLADPSDDDALRAILAQTEMDGSIGLSFRREPSFFTAEQAGNIDSQTLVYADRETGRVTGFGGRTIRRAYVGGRAVDVGYLSMLRGLPETRGGIGLARGYAYLKRLHADGKAPFYYTTILDENQSARSLLTSGRAGLPIYTPIATLVTYLLPLRRAVSTASDFVVRADADLLPPAVHCLDDWNRRHQLAPVVGIEDLAANTSMFPGFDFRDMYLVLDGNRVTGTLGVWDQQAFKQTIVASYSPNMRRIRPLYNAFARMRGIPSLPAIGAPVKTVYAAFVSSADDDPCVMESLIGAARRDWSGRGFDYLALGIVQGHALEPVIATAACRKINSTLYLVNWADDGVMLPAFGPVHVEIATL